jgi:hypothetical protein
MILSAILVQVHLAQEKKQLSVAWIYSQVPGHVTALPTVRWLQTGKAILYDGRKRGAERTLGLFDPATLRRTPHFDAAKALESLRNNSR